jgi:hypothetical protein
MTLKKNNKILDEFTAMTNLVTLPRLLNGESKVLLFFSLKYFFNGNIVFVILVFYFYCQHATVVCVD